MKFTAALMEVMTGNRIFTGNAPAGSCNVSSERICCSGSLAGDSSCKITMNEGSERGNCCDSQKVPVNDLRSIESCCDSRELDTAELGALLLLLLLVLVAVRKYSSNDGSL